MVKNQLTTKVIKSLSQNQIGGLQRPGNSELPRSFGTCSKSLSQNCLGSLQRPENFELPNGFGTCSKSLLLATALSICAGCPEGRPGPDDKDRQTRAVLGVVAEFYGSYLRNRKGKAPKDNEDFHNYLASRAEELKLYNVESPDQLFNSPRDERPLVIVSGQVVAPPDYPESPWAAFEQKGADGKRYGVRVRGGVHELTTEEIDQILASKE